MKKNNILLFIVIFTLGIILRFWQLGRIPDSLNWDEASWGYNAYTIAETGKDEYGVSFPLSFKAFGDFKQPVYIYLDAIAIKIFGLNAFAVRFPSALFGSLAIIFVFLLVYELFKTNKFAKQLAYLLGQFNLVG
jgi:4-amino-4-deoxy-L-arabinose transferase-like glycosyltransferase